MILNENLVKIDFEKDYWNVQKKYRESSYILNNLISIYESDLYDKSLLIKAKEELEKFYKYDKGISSYENSDALEETAATLAEDGLYEIKVYQGFRDIEQAIRGKSDLDSIQYEMLNEMIEKTLKKNDLLSEKLIEIDRIKRDERIRRLLNYMKSDSHLRDKLDTYEISINTKGYSPKEKKELNKELKQQGMSNPYYIYNIQDFEYLLQEARERFENEYKILIKALDLLNDNKAVKIDKRKNNLQFWFNIILVVATIFDITFVVLTYLYK